MEPIDVTARFNTDGKIIPISFLWKGSTYPVESTGRSWADEKGQHILVMVPGGHIYELFFASAEHRWYLSQVGPGRTIA